MADFWNDGNYPVRHPWDFMMAIEYAKVLAYSSTPFGDVDTVFRQAWQLMTLTYSILPQHPELGVMYKSR